MGKGDIKTRRGKIFAGSFGKSRPRKAPRCHRPPIPSHISSAIKEESRNYLNLSPIGKSAKTLQPEWFEPKPYIHLGDKLFFSDKKWIQTLVQDEKWVAKYHFFPLIHRKLLERRYKRCSDGKKAHFDTKKNESTQKQRHIFYANHMDNAIFTYYSKVILGAMYEQALDIYPDSDLKYCPSAYRSIKVETGRQIGKSNIHFAKEVFDYIRSQKECVALAFDITGFFDNLDHGNLKQAWARLLNCPQGKLPDDHYNIFKALTRFSYIEEPALFQLHGLQTTASRKNLHQKTKHLRSYCKGKNRKERNRYFREQIAKKLIIPHSVYDNKIAKGVNRGIPQGTSISALLANLYLLEFDKKVLIKVKSVGGFYRRYSDDIMIVCPQENESEIEKYVIELITSQDFKLEINSAKTEKAYFYNNGFNISSNRPIKYLGFEFNGEKTLVKSSSLAKYHRRMKNSIKRKVRKIKNLKRHFDSAQRLWTDEIWRKYSTKGTRNFLCYIRRASQIMGAKSIAHQVRNHKRILQSYMKKHRFRHGL